MAPRKKLRIAMYRVNFERQGGSGMLCSPECSTVF
jgi:hypothetical protein